MNMDKMHLREQYNLFAFILVLGFCTPLSAESTVSADSRSLMHVDTIPHAYIDAAAKHQIPPILLYAIALTESADYQFEFVSRNVGRRAWPWTLNVHGEGFRYASREEACIALVAKLKTTRVIDVGIAQLNIHWNPKLFRGEGRFANPCDALDPYDNLEEAARLVNEHYRTSNDWILAAGRYHRPAGGEPARRYRSAVAREIQRILMDASLVSVNGG